MAKWTTNIIKPDGIKKKKEKEKPQFQLRVWLKSWNMNPKTLRISKSNVNFEVADKKVFSVHFQAAFLRTNCHYFQMTHTQGRAHKLARNLSL